MATITVTMAPPGPGYYETRATVSSLAVDPNPANNTQLLALSAVDLPLLRILPGDAVVVLSWPSNALAFALEHSALPANGNWLPVGTIPVIIGEDKVVTNAVANGARFFRLRRAQ